MNAEALAQIPAQDSAYTFLLQQVGPDRMRAFIEALEPLEALTMKHSYALFARQCQRYPEGVWSVWVLLGGRGLGKTWTGGHTVNNWAEELGYAGHIALVGKDPGDIRDVMIENKESGILATAPPWFRPRYEPSKRKLTWPNGCQATTYSAETPDDLRGPQHHKAWGDEPCKWKYGQSTWDMLEFGLRLGHNPQALLTGTPRPLKWFLELLKAEGTVVTTGTTYENKANLSKKFLDRVKKKYEGTRLGQQELHARILSDTPGALWTQERLESLRVKADRILPAPVPLVSFALAIDPPGSGPADVLQLNEGSEEDGTECGLVYGGRGEDGHLYVCGDLSGVYSPAGWGARAVSHAHTLRCDTVLGEQNFGGNMVEYVVRTAAKEAGVEVAYRQVTASRGKQLRAEPISALYEQGRAHHVGMFADLEDEMTTWVPGMKSPNRLDALVWMATGTMLDWDGGWELR